MDVLLSEALGGHADSGPVSGWRQRTSGGGRADGNAVGPARGRNPDGTPRFDQAVGSGAYLWWYVDGLSDCGTHAITLIAFVGSVFSPYYAWARERASRHGAFIDPENFCALNVALYTPGRKRWTMTERSRASVERSARHFCVGPSALEWTGTELIIRIDERSAPIPFAVRGTVRLRAPKWFDWQVPLDPSGRHRWGPLAPSARISVDFESPGIQWQGHGYVDSNEGDEPIESRYDEWDWSRATLPDGSSSVVYDLRTRDGREHLIARRFQPDGRVSAFDPGPRYPLARTGWRINRSIRSEAGGPPPKITRTLEDTPFYVRSLAESTVDGQPVLSVHETLNGPRLRSGLVRLMLPWRMPRLR
jgi:carotenoid 1,2-hydratase